MTERLRGSGAELARGFISPSRLALAIAVLTCALVLFVGVPRLAESDANWLLKADKHDYYLAATARLRTLVPAERPTVILLGASSLRMAVFPDDYLEAIMARDGKPPPSIFNLSVPGARSWDLIAMIEALPAGLTGVLVLGLTPKMISYPGEALGEVIAQPRLGLASVIVDEDAIANGIAVPPRTGIDFVDNYRFYAARADSLLGHLLRFLAGERRARRATVPEVRAEYLTSYREQVRTHYRARSKANLATVALALERLRTRSRMAVVVAESPVSSQLREGMGEPLYREHVTRLTDFARDMGGLFINFNNALRAGDILDYAHVTNNEARARCSEALAGVLRFQLDQLAQSS